MEHSRLSEDGGTPAWPAQRARSRLSSVANSLRLLKVFSDEDSEIGISALAQRLGLAKSTVHRLASTLIGADMLEQNPETGRYRLGLALLELGALVRRNMDVSNEAKPYLRMLRETTGKRKQWKRCTWRSSTTPASRHQARKQAGDPHEFRSRRARARALHRRRKGAARIPAGGIRRRGHRLRAAGAHAAYDHRSESPAPRSGRRSQPRVRDRQRGERTGPALGRRDDPVRIRCGDRLAQRRRTGAPDQQERPWCPHAREVVKAADAISQRLGYRPPRQAPFDRAQAHGTSTPIATDTHGANFKGNSCRNSG